MLENSTWSQWIRNYEIYLKFQFCKKSGPNPNFILMVSVKKKHWFSAKIIFKLIIKLFFRLFKHALLKHGCRRSISTSFICPATTTELYQILHDLGLKPWKVNSPSPSFGEILSGKYRIWDKEWNLVETLYLYESWTISLRKDLKESFEILTDGKSGSIPIIL